MMDHQEDFRRPDRRIFRRAATSLLMSYRVNTPLAANAALGGQEVDAVAQDISENGLGVFTNHRIPTGARIHMRFKVFNHSAVLEKHRYRALELDGDVRYAIMTDRETDYRLGIQFLGATETDLDFFSDYVQTNQLDSSQEGG